jgi:hypothetical protein
MRKLSGLLRFDVEAPRFQFGFACLAEARDVKADGNIGPGPSGNSLQTLHELAQPFNNAVCKDGIGVCSNLDPFLKLSVRCILTFTCWTFSVS